MLCLNLLGEETKRVTFVTPAERQSMNARLDELLTRLIEAGPFPGISCSEGHELVDSVRLLKADNERLYDLLKSGEIIAKEIYEENKLALAAKDKRMTELEEHLMSFLVSPSVPDNEIEE